MPGQCSGRSSFAWEFDENQDERTPIPSLCSPLHRFVVVAFALRPHTHTQRSPRFPRTTRASILKFETSKTGSHNNNLILTCILFSLSLFRSTPPRPSARNTEYKGFCQFATDCRSWAYVCRQHLCDCADGYRPDATNQTCVGGEYFVWL